MKELLKDLLFVFVALLIFAAGFFLGSHPAIIATAATQVGLGDFYTQVAPALGLITTTAAAETTATTGNALGFTPPDGAFELSEDQTVELVPMAAAMAGMSASGAVMAAATQTVLVPVAGEIAEVAVQVGEPVSAGDLLFTLDMSALEAEVQRSLTQLSTAQQSTAETAAQEVADAQAALETAAKNLALAEVTAPVDGEVLAVQVEVGQSAAVDALAVILSTSTALDVSVTLSADAAAQLSVDQPITVTVDSLPDQLFTGVIAEITALADAANTLMLIHLGEDAIGKVEPGMTASVTIQQDTSGGWAVPSTAVQDRNGNQMVFVVRDGRSMPVAVTTLSTQGDTVIVQSSDLQDGDRVVLDMLSFFGGGQIQRGTGQFPGNGNFPGNGQRQTQPQN